MCKQRLPAMALCATLCATLIAFTQSWAASPARRSLSLEDCIELALIHNLDVQIERQNAHMARDLLGAANGVYVPVLSFRAQHLFEDRPGDFEPQKANIDFPYQYNADQIGPSLTGRLPLGLSYDLSAVGGERDATTDLNADPGAANDYPGGIRRTNNFTAETSLTLRQHLLKDFWIDQDRVTLLFRRKDLQVSQQVLRFQIMRTVLAVELGYYDLIATRQRVGVEEKAVELRRQFVTETRRRVEVGDLPPLDSEQAETQLQNALTSLATAQEAEGTLQNSLKMLVSENFEEWADLDLLPTDTLVAISPELNRPESVRLALKKRPDLAEARLAVEKSNVAIQFRKNQLFPSLDLVGRYGGIGIESDIGNAISDAGRFRHDEYFYGVVVSLPLSNVTERNNYQASKAAKRVAELQLKKAEQEVMVQVADWVNRVRSRFTQVDSTRKARHYAEAALAAEQRKLQNGLSTSFVVLQLQEILTTARRTEVEALAEYNKALAQLAFAEGSLLEKHHLQVEVK